MSEVNIWCIKEKADEIHIQYYDIDEVEKLRQYLIMDILFDDTLSSEVMCRLTKIINRRFNHE